MGVGFVETACDGPSPKGPGLLERVDSVGSSLRNLEDRLESVAERLAGRARESGPSKMEKHATVTDAITEAEHTLRRICDVLIAIEDAL